MMQEGAKAGGHSPEDPHLLYAAQRWHPHHTRPYRPTARKRLVGKKISQNAPHPGDAWPFSINNTELSLILVEKSDT